MIKSGRKYGRNVGIPAFWSAVSRGLVNRDRLPPRGDDVFQNGKEYIFICRPSVRRFALLYVSFSVSDGHKTSGLSWMTCFYHEKDEDRSNENHR